MAAPRLKLDRNLIIWVAVGLFLLFIGLIFIKQGPDLGQQQIDERQKEEALKKTQQTLQARVNNPAGATDAALTAAQKQKTKTTPTPVPMSSIPGMPALPSNLAQQAREMQLEQYKRTLESIEKRKSGERVPTPGRTVNANTGASAGPSFVLYGAQPSGQGGGASPSGVIPLYKPVPPKAASQPAQGEKKITANTAPESAASAPLSATHDREVKLASAQIMAQRANGRYWLAPGTVINAVLLNAVNTLLPGALTARVTQNIYDSRYGTHLVIPAGSILRGQYNSSVQDGQNRVFMAFDTLVTPSGGIVSLGNMSASDALGRSGMPGDLHTHFWERMGISTLLALEAVGMDRISPNQSSSSFGGTTTSPATNGAQIIVNTANQELQRRYSVKPNITIDAGQPLTIVTTGSIEVPPIANTR